MDPAMSRDSGLFWNKPAYSGLFLANSDHAPTPTGS